MRTRIRRVVAPPIKEGAHCPPRLQKSLCSPKTFCGNSLSDIAPLVLPLQDRHLKVSVYVGPWSNCSHGTSLPSQNRLLVRRDSTFAESLQNSARTFPSKKVTFPSEKVVFPLHKVPGLPWITQSDTPDQSSKSHPPVIGTRTREVLCRGGEGEG